MNPEPATLDNLQLAVDAAGVGTWGFNPRSGELVFSDRCKELFGLPLDQPATYEALEKAVCPDDRPLTDSAVARALDPQGPGTYDIEYRVCWRGPEAPPRWVRATGRVYFNADHTEAQYFIGTLSDITDLKAGQESTRQREADFAALADSIAQLAWIADASGHIFWYNRRWYDYTGTTLEEMEGWGWEKVHHPDYVQGVVARISEAFATGEAWEDTFPLRGQDGQYRWFLSRAIPQRDAQGKVTRWFGTNTDVTEMRHLQEQLQNSYNDLEVKVTFRTLALEREVQELRARLAGGVS